MKNLKLLIPVLIIFILEAFSACSYSSSDTEESSVSVNKIEHGKYVSSFREESEDSGESTVPPEEKDPVKEILAEMSLEERVGQVILARYPDDPEAQSEKYHFGGYTLYAKDFENETPEGLAEKLSAVKAASAVPPFIAADEEGGEIVRISKYPAFADKPLPSVSSAAAEGRISEFADETADVLNRAGVNLNLAPVADVAENESDYIYSRTCKMGYRETGEVIAELTENLNKRGIMCCLKHFPGYGSNLDTHTGIAVDERSSENFESRDFIPFKAGVDAGAPMIMVNHNIVTAYNADIPASLAPEVHEILRGLGFEGIIVTDDLGMDAISFYTDRPYVTAFLAGNDMLCASDGAECYTALLEAVQSGEITEERLDESVYRILSAKAEYGIL